MNFINQIAFDRVVKEYVLITNLQCTLDHSTPEAFRESHGGAECKMLPSEGIALRIIGFKNKRPIVGWTYRSVKYRDLSCGIAQPEHQRVFDAVLNGKRTAYNIGRI